MGRKGMKGFIKSAARSSARPEEDASEQAEAAASAAPAPSSPKKQQQRPTPVKAVSESNADPRAASDDESGGQETRGQMLQRHKRELLAHKKAVQRMGKKSKDELAKMEAEIEARHAKELQELDAGVAAAAPNPAAAAAAAGSASSSSAAADGTAGAAAAAAAAPAAAAAAAAAAADKASKYLKDVSIDEDEADAAAGKGKPSKAQKRRDKAAAAAAEREARIAAELSNLGTSERVAENRALKKLLAPLGLGIKEIRADGHCLYRSLEDQLIQAAAAAADGGAAADDDDVEEPSVFNYQELRELAAEHIRQHKEQFAPFLLPEDEEEDPEQHYEKYCFALETTAAWGGHLELTALADALQRTIKVYAVGMAPICLGEQYTSQPPLELCYLQHAFGLGEHYNSTKKQRFVTFAVGGESDNGESDEAHDDDEEGGAGADGNAGD